MVLKRKIEIRFWMQHLENVLLPKQNFDVTYGARLKEMF